MKRLKKLYASATIVMFLVTPTFAAVPGYDLIGNQCVEVLDNASFSSLNDCNFHKQNAIDFSLAEYRATSTGTRLNNSRMYISTIPVEGSGRVAGYWRQSYNQGDCWYVQMSVIPLQAQLGGGEYDVINPNNVWKGYNWAYGGNSNAYYADTSYAGCLTSLGAATSTKYSLHQDGFTYETPNNENPSTLCTTNCYSNVMFFPGIMGSKLYEETDNNKVWDSGIDSEQAKLAMDSNGYSINSIHTSASTTHATEGVIPEILGGNIYKSFMSDLAEMKASSTIGIDYALIPYDWRLPLSEIVQKGNVQGDKVYYGTPVSNLQDSFIIKELQKLADTSKSGKVTIVAHSNGGLVTKELIQTLKETNNPLYNKIDKVIFVGVPQVGTPKAVVGLLHGHGLGPFKSYLLNKRSRDLAHNMPMSYNLLPNQNYINTLDAYALDSKVVTFDDSVGLAQQRAQYGNLVNNQTELQNYILGTDSRTKPVYDNTGSPNIGNATLYANANATHQRVDTFELASSTKLIQIAGWGEDTVAGIDYKSYLAEDGDYYTSYKIRKTVDGDGTVVVPSALYTPLASNSERWWVNLDEYNGILNSVPGVGNEHADIFEVSNLRKFVKETIQGINPEEDSIVSKNQPSGSNSKRLHYTLHSPLTLGVIDDQGRYTGKSTTTQEIINQIPGADYDVYGEVQTVSVPVGVTHTVILDGYQQGSFSLDIDKQEGNTITASTTFTGIPSTTQTIATLHMGVDANVASSTLKIDQNGDGTTDTTLTNNPSGFVVYDVTPPELRLTFSTSTKDVILSAVDNFDSNPSITVGTSTITLKDNQGNTTVISFTKFKDTASKLVFTYNTISRNVIATQTPNTSIAYDWKLDPQNQLKDLDTAIKINGIVMNTFNFKKNNTTTISFKNLQSGITTKTTQSGFVPVTVSTKNTPDLLNVSY